MKQRIKITADDGNMRIELSARITVRNREEDREISADEQKHVRKVLTRRLAESVRGISYCDFGIENTKVR